MSAIGSSLDLGEVSEVVMPADVHRLRYMFADGKTLDVLSPLTDSRVSEFAYQTHYGRPSSGKGNDQERIVGHTDLGVVARWPIVTQAEEDAYWEQFDRDLAVEEARLARMKAQHVNLGQATVHDERRELIP